MKKNFRKIRRNCIGNKLRERENKTYAMDGPLIIGLVTAMGYFTAYSYKKGFNSYYGLNEVLLGEITISSIISSTLSIFGLLFLFILIGNGLNATFPKEDPNVYVRLMRREISLPIWFIIAGVLLFPLSNESLNLAGICAVVLIAKSIIDLFTYSRNVEGFKNKVTNFVNRGEGFSLEVLEHNINTKRFGRVILFILLPLFVSNIANIYGNTSASQKEEYLVIMDPKPFVVITEFNRNFVIAPIDLENKKVQPSFTIIESKSKLDEQVVFKSVTFEDGLEVEESNNSIELIKE